MNALLEMADGEFKRSTNLQLFEHALDDWYAKDQRQNKSFMQVKNAMELHVRPYLKDFKLSNIEKRDIIRIIDRIAIKAHTQANRVLAFTRRFFNWCVARDLLAVSPANGIAKAKIDKVALEGSGVAPEPTGLRLQSGIGHTALNAALTNYAPFITARTGILSANGGPITAIVLHPRDEGTLAGLLDSTNQPLNAPPAIAGVPMLTTSAIQTDAGSSNNESNAYVGNFSNLLIGLRNDVRVEVLRERFATTHEYAFVAHCRFDIAISHAASFHKISSITP